MYDTHGLDGVRPMTGSGAREARCLPAYRPTRLFGPHLQTAAAHFRPGRGSSYVGLRRRVVVETTDGTGDRLIATLEAPRKDRDLPLVAILHGLCGSATSPYVRTCAGNLHRRGIRTLSINARGCGDSSDTCRRVHHPAMTGDLLDVLRHVDTEHGEWSRNGIVLAGMSLGGDTVLRFLGEQPPVDIRAGVAVSPTIDLEATTALVESQWVPYASMMLSWMKQEFLRPCSNLSDRERTIVEEASTITDLHESFTAPHFGLRDAAEFYASCSPLDWLPGIEVPTLVLSAEDDPIVPTSAVNRIASRSSPQLRTGFVERGGHVGFAQRSGPRWHHECIAQIVHEVATPRLAIAGSFADPILETQPQQRESA